MNDDWVSGALDCIAGVAHQDGQGDDYDNGFNHQYQAEQNDTHRSEICEK